MAEELHHASQRKVAEVERVAVLAVLDGTSHDYAHMARPLLRALDATHHFHLDAVTEHAHLSLDRHRVVIAASHRAPQAGRAAESARFVQSGGGLVLLHGTLARWSSGGELSELSGWAPSGPGPLTELVVRAAGTNALTARDAIRVEGARRALPFRGTAGERQCCSVRAGISPSRSWPTSVGLGQGVFIHIGLGHEAATYEQAIFQRLIHRAVRHASGFEPAAPAGVGLIGYGAIARDHAAAIAATPGLSLAGVCDLSAERREQAARDWSVPAHARAEELLADAEVGLVVVGTPPSAHADAVLSALECRQARRV